MGFSLFYLFVGAYNTIQILVRLWCWSTILANLSVPKILLPALDVIL